MLSNGLKSRVVKLGLLVLSLGLAGSVWAQSMSEQQIAERLQPAGNVCLAGEECASGGATVAASAASAVFSAEATYNQYCAMCHNTGMAGAPERSNAAHWEARIADAGIDTIVSNAISGINAMPPRGMCSTCSDDQIAELVDYLSGN
ncbi:c-type cytochrome [Pseudohongiella sp.]|uniref:Cytochrome c domain-containing protein n=1 Tax=marine sediment metagenome TaxID=412755 RepID=A0A0F9W953_9ZZZZ|nr:c-type cytochrome [Pseudohongiella sp.]HDZ08738.1 cytochrome c5 family protein [Pseudohongiella sp.]HEA62354.1 cytochrome c5 family protein [Pseudohongiella sp.]